MPERLAKGTWVEILGVVLPAGERAPQAPEDTANVPLEMRVKGFLVESAELGSEAEITTTTGRRQRGAVMTANPPYDHGFGEPLPELLEIGGEVRAILHARDQGK
ncbi:MAG: 2-amino-4-oxopentanoate thiolase subunit OrtA [Alphaproteobacteria bacterium]|nr:2-amino-4-oxopentanoate thiolase subunit OrtA [Alphaproteobacteria bacterium]